MVQDSTSPVVTLLGASSVEIDIGDTYGTAEDAGATASDNLDGDLTSSIVTTGLPVDSSSASTQSVVYTVTDSQNLSASITRTVIVKLPFYQHPGAITGATVLADAMPGDGGSDITITFRLLGTPTAGSLLKIGNQSMGNQSGYGFRLYWAGGTLWNVGVVGHRTRTLPYPWQGLQASGGFLSTCIVGRMSVSGRRT